MGGWPAADEAARLARRSGAENGARSNPSFKQAQTALTMAAPTSEDPRAEVGAVSRAPTGQRGENSERFP
ncbi:hypothetical protein NDU88_000443 [Pleurodeles waltl]|uniref:Uncharacterized protein n=1 Tax=Pleurodeles waltl TaxID=8319 RepID=A0AAV7Q0S2_PLEWA|nr:hypothetical protein NDU88_000443 [Pleurodeles waltl]